MIEFKSGAEASVCESREGTKGAVTLDIEKGKGSWLDPGSGKLMSLHCLNAR